MPTDEELMRRLDRQLAKDRKRLERYDRYYEGEQPLRFMVPELQAELGDRITQLVINWPRKGTDTYEHRLDIEGFRYPGADSGDEVLWDMWQENKGAGQSQEAHLEALALGRAFAIVGAPDDDDDPPILTVEHPFQVTASRDPRTRKVSMALKRWRDDDERIDHATLYLPDRTVYFERSRRQGWRETDRDPHELGEVPVVPIVNRARMLRKGGVSEFHDVVPIADAANKMATDMMVSGEFHAMPRRWVFGMTEDDFADEAGNPLSTWSVIAGRLWATDKNPKDVTVGQFDETDLKVFHETIKLLAALAAEMLALPANYMRFVSDNPTSADAVRADEVELVKRCERKQTAFGDSWEEVQRLMLRFHTGAWDPKARRLETLWRDPATPTVAQIADAVVKKVQSGIIPLEQAREDLGYSPEQRRRMAEMDDDAAARDTLALVAGSFRRPLPDDPDTPADAPDAA